MYVYKNITVPIYLSKKTSEDTFSECMSIVNETAKEGWRLVQIIVVPKEKMGLMAPHAYELIFEKETA